MMSNYIHSCSWDVVIRPHTNFNTLRPKVNGRHFADDIFKCIFLSENVLISFKTSLKIVPKVPINSIPALVNIMAWCQLGDRPSSEPMMASLLTHICATRPQCVLTTVWLYRHWRECVLKQSHSIIHMIGDYSSMSWFWCDSRLYIYIRKCACQIHVYNFEMW